uniref:uncharacterized protein LOC101597484 isoform X2 n=1 Tax=Jaculus jaculus TaxID=51337 RepID=UPI001E1B0538|nr:uncharacterized protein LOC101597484 isoform X2 [Jaculus jaculus]
MASPQFGASTSRAWLSRWLAAGLLGLQGRRPRGGDRTVALPGLPALTAHSVRSAWNARLPCDFLKEPLAPPCLRHDHAEVCHVGRMSRSAHAPRCPAALCLRGRLESPLLCSDARGPGMYMQVEARTSSCLHLKRAPGIRSWSLLVGILSTGLAAAYYSGDSLGWKLFYVTGCLFVAVQNLEDWEEAIFNKSTGKVVLKTFSLYRKLLTLLRAGHDQVMWKPLPGLSLASWTCTTWRAPLRSLRAVTARLMALEVRADGLEWPLVTICF